MTAIGTRIKRSSAQHPIYHVHTPGADRPALFELELDAAARVDEEWNACAEQHRVHVESHLVDHSGREQRAREVAAAEDADLLARPLLELAHELAGVVLHERHAFTLDAAERARENVGVHVAHLASTAFL